LLPRGQEAFRGKVAGPASRKVKVEGKVSGIVFWQMCGLVGRGEVGEVEPVPGCDQYVFCFDVAMEDVACMTVSDSAE